MDDHSRDEHEKRLPDGREFLCTIKDLDATGAIGIERNSPPFEIVVVGSKQKLQGYVNSCPHMGTPLEMSPGKFLDETKTQLICSTHGARFNVNNGICTFGPCKGQALQTVKLHIFGENVYFYPQKPGV